MKLGFVIISALFSFLVLGQDVNFGINFGTNPYNRFKFENDQSSFKPENSFYTYGPKVPGENIIFDEHKFFNTIHFGLSARISRKKIGLNIEPQILFEYIRFRFKVPYQSNRILSRRAYRIPIYGTYHLFNNPLALHINAGIIISTNKYFDYQQPDPEYYVTDQGAWEKSINYGDNHLYNVFYDDALVNMDYMLGIGKRINNLDYNLRYVNSIGNGDLRGVRWQIELTMNFYFLSKEEFSTKNYLYEE